MSERHAGIPEPEFIQLLVTEFDVASPPSAEASLTDDLGFDSVDMLNLILFIEEAAGFVAITEPEVYPVIRTVHDAYVYYEDALGEEWRQMDAIERVEAL